MLERKKEDITVFKVCMIHEAKIQYEIDTGVIILV